MTSRFLTLFWRQVVRQSWRHPLLTGLNILSIALGITVFLAVQIANRGAISSFRSAADLTTGRAQLEIRGNIPDQLFPAVRAVPGVRAATPLVEGVVSLPDHPGEYLRVLGVDPFTGTEVFSFVLEEAAGTDLNIEKWLADSEAVALQPERARELGSAPFRILAGTSIRTVRPAFVLAPDNPLTQADTRLAAMDIGWAQELLGVSGHFSSIQLLLEDSAGEDAVIREIQAIVPADVTVARPAMRSTEMESMLGAFQLNLTALSLVSVIVGMFLIQNSVGAAVIRRRTEIAILRAGGATRFEIRSLFLGEAVLEALLGIALGLLLAPLLAGWMSAPISSSVSSLYTLVRLEHFTLAPEQIALAFIIGLGAALGAAWLPASEAARSDPARILHPGAAMETRSPLRLIRLGGSIVILAAAFGLSYAALEGGPRYLGFAAAAAVLGGFSLLVPWLAAAVGQCFRHSGPLVRCAADQFSRSLHRNAMTIAALAAALAMTVSVTVMIFSFRASVERWIDHTLMADLYIAPAVNDVAGLQAFLPEAALSWANEQPAVAASATFREIPIKIQNEATSLAVIEGRARGDLQFVEGSGRNAAEDFLTGKAVAVSESFARRFHLAGGQTVVLSTPVGEKEYPIAGVYRDFTRDRGTVLMQRSLFAKSWDDPRVHSLALKLADPRQADAMAEAFRRQFGAEGVFAIYDNAALRTRIMDIFDQTFAVTSILRSIAVAVAVTGVLFSLSVLVIERERQIGVLRAVGASRFQVLAIFLIEAFLIGITATISGLASGGLLAMVLTWVINKAYFGWTIELTFPLATLAATPLWLIPAAIVAALLPAWRASLVTPARAVRFE